MAGYVFISYSRQDATYVDQLVAELDRAGIEVWRDTGDIRYGDPWERRVEQGVDGAAVVVVVMSPAAEASPHVADELHRTRKRSLPVLPILLAGEPFFALDKYLRFDARGGALPDERFLRRLRELAADAPPAVTGRVPRAVAAGAGQLVVGDPPGRAVAWQDRPGLLQELVRLAGGEDTSVVCALAGQRGVGKTQLAAAYARLRIAHGWPVIVWAVAETEEGVVTALDELATMAGVRGPGAEPEQAARAGLRWLRAQPGPCLLVYDNAVDADLISRWTPSVGAVHTVVTTTHRDLDTLGDLLDVNLFTTAEAVAYLRRRTGVDDDTGAAEVAEQLGRLPLALGQAGALIGARRRYRDYSRYRQALDGADTAGLLPRPQGDPYPHGLAEAILLSLDDLAQADPGQLAGRLLDQLAVLAPTGADTVLLHHLINPKPPVQSANPADRLDPDEIVAVLAGRSLTIAAREDDRTVAHRLVQRVVRERRRHDGTLGKIITATAQAVVDAAREVGDGWATRALIAEYAAHLDTLTSHASDTDTRRQLLKPRAWLLYWLQEVNNTTAAIASGAALLADCEAILGGEYPDTLINRNNLANAYQEAGRLGEAITLHEQNLADRQRVRGDDHPDTLISRYNLANAYQDAGRVDEAIALHEQTLADRQRVLGDDHRDTLHSRNNLANAYRAAGRVDEAIALHRQTLADRQRVLGGDHPDTLNSRSNLATAYRAAGRVDEAIALHEQTLADRQRVLGDDHPDILNSRNNLANAYQDAGRVDEAVSVHEQTLADRQRVLGDDHPDTLHSRNNLAIAYQDAGRVDEAVSVHEQTLADRQRVLGGDHPDTLTSRSNLAAARTARDNRDRGEGRQSATGTTIE